MMQKFLLFLLVASTGCLTGCLEILEEVHLNKDGSGKYVVNLDMSALFSDPMMKGMAEGMLREQGPETNGPLEIDTVIALSDVPMGELSKEEQDLLQGLIVKVQASEAGEKMLLRLEFDFDEPDDVGKLGMLMEKMGKEQAGPGSMMGAGFLPNYNSFKVKKRTFTRLPKPETSKETAAEDENMELVKMFLDNASFTTVYHLPGQVKSTTIENAEVDGKIVTVTYNLLEMMDGKSRMEGDIKFKRK